MKINDVNDDVRLQSLNKPPTSKKATQETARINPEAPISRDGKGQANIHPRSNKDRRQGERRRQQRKVLLDTRSAGDRRKSPRRATDKTSRQDKDGAQRPNRGIDVNC